jgi:hypothetical protein
MILAIDLSFLGAHYTGRGRVASAEGIVFGTTVLVPSLKISAMIVASRVLHEALFAGLLEIIVGFVVPFEFDNII